MVPFIIFGKNLVCKLTLINAYGEAIGITTGGHDESGANLNFAKNIKVLNLSNYSY